MADNTPEPPSDCITPEELEEWYYSQGDYITDQTRQTAIREYLSLQKTHHLLYQNTSNCLNLFQKLIQYIFMVYHYQMLISLILNI